MFTWRKFATLSGSKIALRGLPNPRFWPGSGDPGRAKLDLLILAILALSCLLLLTIGQRVTAFDHASDTDPWLWLEAEEFADSNFPHASRSTRGEFCDTCSGAEYLLFLPDRPGRPFDPPGYWYADYALRVPAPGDYRHVWLALSPHDAAFSWSVDAQSPITVTVVETAPPYGDPTFHGTGHKSCGR